MMRKWILGAICATLPLLAAQEEEVYEFSGKHFVASYLHCDAKAICDLQGLMDAMEKAVEASGATVLDKSYYIFPPHGLTLVYLLSESHASIHTYPEFGSCFVDLFTCGNKCSAQNFDAILREYLQPKEVNARFFLRNDQVEEVSYLPSEASNQCLLP